MIDSENTTACDNTITTFETTRSLQCKDDMLSYHKNSSIQPIPEIPSTVTKHNTRMNRSEFAETTSITKSTSGNSKFRNHFLPDVIEPCFLSVSQDNITLQNNLDNYVSSDQQPSNFKVKYSNEVINTRTEHCDQVLLTVPSRERTRLVKWRQMIGCGLSEWKPFAHRNPGLLQRRVRKGVPDSLRGIVWQLLSGSRELVIQNMGIYAQLVFQESPLEVTIIRDMGRTFPTHPFFQKCHGLGQRSLYNVLKAYSVYDSDVGYMQGMGFMVAMLLLYMSEEDTFWMMVALVKGAQHPPMEGLYLPGLPLVQKHLNHFNILLSENCPKLAAHFQQEGVEASMYCSQWFITVFTYSLPLEALLRIWDVFLLEGFKVVYRVGLAILTQAQEHLLTLLFEDLIVVLRNLHQICTDPDDLLRRSMSIRVSRQLEELHKTYR
mmetsp:Transcript_29084/g.40160  ORF Transcript_29084/g.40160 Transcript_29084/m.40160 type:complete len:435 (+) Transcript_29084:32-1336(+)|eukprot:CAMPEP_0196574666 /NCGR_PEP_ID=MMETSP1081-20130531/4338_1 /TAXON_ID=36882 /ORGANISM="Pyramimonas amylifera, Strain CCMP720" /LENGTH=434 /DNA_ID=CAMNT_0041892759 /DNA_START=32 /DNA_END=1336 /DNA_ORIENTATION=-